jgi:hypothetical protein
MEYINYISFSKKKSYQNFCENIGRVRFIFLVYSHTVVTVIQLNDIKALNYTNSDYKYEFCDNELKALNYYLFLCD